MPHPETNPTKARIVAIAMKLFHTQGYNATGIAQILQKSGVNSGSLYHFFDSKAELLEAVLQRYTDLLMPVIVQPVLDGVADPIERVFALLELYRQNLLRTRFRYGCPIGNLALEVGDGHAAARRLIARNFEGWRDQIRRMLDDARHRLPPDLDRDRLATFVLTTMEGGVMQSRAYESVAPFDASVAMLRDYIDRLLATQDQSSSTKGVSS